MVKTLSALMIAIVLLTPVSADAGVRSGLKRAAVKVGHVCENVLYVAAATAALIVVCKSGACN